MGSLQTIPYEQYQQLPPEKRSRPLTDQEFAALTPEELAAAGLAERSEGAPANFGGRVLPNPDHIQPHLDTDPIAPVTRLPVGVSFHKQNFTGTPPMDLSNPSATDAIPAAGRTIAAQMTPPPQAMPWEEARQQKSPESAAMPWEEARAAKTAAPPPKVPPKAAAEPVPTHWYTGVIPTLGREVGAAGNAIASIPGALYHAAADPETAQESARYGKGFEKKIGPTGRLIDRTIIQPTQNAIEDYAHGRVTPEAALSVAPEAIGSAAGNIVGGKIIADAPGVIREAPKVIRRLTPKDLAQGAGAATGAGLGHGALSVPGAYAGAKGAGVLAEKILGGERANSPIGFPSRVEGGPAYAPEFKAPSKIAELDATGENEPFAGGVDEPPPPRPQKELDATGENKPFAGGLDEYTPKPIAKAKPAATISATQPSIAEAAPAPSPSSLLTKTGRIKPAVAQGLQDQIERGLGNEQPVAAQPIAKAPAAAKLPEGFTPVESTALKGYKYDPAAREFEYITKDGSHYVRGDVAPEAAAQFEKTAAEKGSFGTAWHELRNNPQGGVGQFKVINGKRVAVVKTAPISDLADQIKSSVGPSTLPARAPISDLAAQLKTAKPADASAPIPKAAAEGDLTEQLTRSVEKANADRGRIPKASETPDYQSLIDAAMKEGPAWTPEKASPIVEELNKLPGNKFEVRGSVGEGKSTANDLDLWQKSGNLKDARATLEKLGFKYNGKTPHGETYTNGAQHVDLWDSAHEPVKGYTGAKENGPKAKQ